MRHSLIVICLFMLAACTQPPAMVDIRGSQDYSGGRNNYQTVAAAPVASVSQAAPIMSFNTPMQTSTTLASPSSVMVSDLAPAAGKPEPAPAAVKNESQTLSLPAPVNQWTSKPREEATVFEAPATKTATLTTTTPGAYIWPVSSHEILSGFGPKGAGKANDGINIAASKGEPVWAAADGEIVYADNKLKGYGNMVIVKHKGNKTTSYAHLARMGVEKYDRVKQGDIIGYVGTTGSVAKPQLYFSMRDGSLAVDPQKFVGKTVAGL